MSEKVTSLNDIIAFLGNEIKSIEGNPEGLNIHYLKDSENADKYTLDWVNSARPDQQNIAESSKAKAIIVGYGIEYSAELKRQEKVILIVDNPRLSIAKVGHAFFVDKINPMIHPTAIIHHDAEIGNNTYIGPNSTIGRCKIGDNVEIHANVVLYDNVDMYDNVRIHANAIIGVEGLGCEREEDGRLVKFPHFGGVTIESEVEIGAHSVIARGVFSDTIIGKGSKMNVGCYIAHNVILGRNVWISPKVNIAGSVKIDDNVTIFSGAIIRDQRQVGEGAIIGMGAVITKNIPSGETWIGNPAKKIAK